MASLTHVTAHYVEKYLNPWRTSIDILKPLTQVKSTFVIKIMKLFDTYLQNSREVEQGELHMIRAFC